ncbi:MAG TPA: NUDIX domain-containing protein [Verrucomicrobiae bacterium]|nr:NUDIX domain-containing protein [Verrucomicrobiae bacterium]
MNTLLVIKDQDFTAQPIQVDISGYKTRQAARAVLLDSLGRVYLINVSLHGYHKLPGGGIEGDEDVEVALARELMEEVGCKAEIIGELGKVIEYRDSQELNQTSYGFLAKQVGLQLSSTLEDDEINEGMVEVKVKNIDAAIKLFRNDSPDGLEGKFIRKRDLAFLEMARSLLPHSA